MSHDGRLSPGAARPGAQLGARLLEPDLSSALTSQEAPRCGDCLLLALDRTTTYKRRVFGLSRLCCAGPDIASSVQIECYQVFYMMRPGAEAAH